MSFASEGDRQRLRGSHLRAAVLWKREQSAARTRIPAGSAGPGCGTIDARLRLAVAAVAADDGRRPAAAGGPGRPAARSNRRWARTDRPTLAQDENIEEAGVVRAGDGRLPASTRGRVGTEENPR